MNVDDPYAGGCPGSGESAFYHLNARWDRMCCPKGHSYLRGLRLKAKGPKRRRMVYPLQIETKAGLEGPGWKDMYIF